MARKVAKITKWVTSGFDEDRDCNLSSAGSHSKLQLKFDCFYSSYLRTLGGVGKDAIVVKAGSVGPAVYV